MLEAIVGGIFILAVVALLISVILVLYFHVGNVKREREQKKINEELDGEEAKKADVRTVIVPDNVDVDESSTVSTQDIDAKKYTIDMAEARGKIEKNIVKDGEVTEEFEANKEPLEEIKDMLKNATSSDDDNPIKQPGNPIKNIIKKDEE